MSINRLKINTPHRLEQLQNHEIGSGFNHISIVPGAHSNILELPQQFANDTTFSIIDFVDEQNNAVRLEPKARLVIAELESGEDLLLGLPHTYRIYIIRLASNAAATEADLDYIVQWKGAEVLQISDSANSNVASGLSQRMDKMKEMTQLKDIKLNIQRESYKELDVRAFLEQLQALKLARFYKSSLNKEERKDFMAHLDVPDNWRYRDRSGFIFIERSAPSQAEVFLSNLVSSFSYN